MSESISVEYSVYLFAQVSVWVSVHLCSNLSSYSELLSCWLYVRTGECVHAELFVAGLAPWEPILHLSIPHSGAQ